MEIDEKELAELRKKAEEADRLRQFLWISHGCPVSALYGDDGEMQCHACRLDFKRMPIEKVFEMLRELMKKAGLWEKVEEIANTRPPCDCPLWDKEIEGCTSEHAGCVFKDVVDTLKEPT